MLSINPIKANLWHSYKHEIFKTSHQQFYRVVVTLPIALAVIGLAAMTVIRVVAPPQGGLPKSSGFNLDLYGWGVEGSFVVANNGVLTVLTSIFNFMIVVACSQAVGSEYSWNTIKMLATRQSSRTKLVLSKCLLAVSMVLALSTILMIVWFAFGWFFKFFFNTPFEFSADDGQAISRGLVYLAISTVQTIIFALLAIAMTFHFKSVIAGVIAYFIYSILDAGLNSSLTALANGQGAGMPDWLRSLLEILRPIQPFLLQGNVNRLMMVEQVQLQNGTTLANPQIVAANPVWLAGLMLVVYVVGLGGLAVVSFARRDITD